MTSTMERIKDTYGRLVHQATMGSTMGRRNDDKKEGTSLEIYAHELACLPIPNKPTGDQSHTYSLVVCLCNIP